MQGWTTSGLSLVGLLLSAGCAGAQVQRAAPLQTLGWSADSVLTWFEREATEGNEATGGVGTARVLQVLRHPEVFSQAKQDSVANGLERLALRADADLVARQAAISYLALAGAASAERPLGSAAERLTRIFHAAHDRSLRRSIIMQSWTLSDQAGMIPLLREIVLTAPDADPSMGIDDTSDPATLAISALARMGEQGRVTLRELLSSNRMRSPRANAELRRVIAHLPRP